MFTFLLRAWGSSWGKMWKYSLFFSKSVFSNTPPLGASPLLSEGIIWVSTIGDL